MKKEIKEEQLELFNIVWFPPCCFDCRNLLHKDNYQFSCSKGRIFPFKKGSCSIKELKDSFKKPRGGSRPGAGRKPLKNPKIKWSGYLSPEVIHFLKVQAKTQGFQESQAELIEYAIREAFYLKSVFPTDSNSTA